MHEHETDHETETGSVSKRHMLIMALCCLMPTVILIAIFAVFPESPYLSFLVLILCPLFMLLMHLPHMIPKKKGIEKGNESS